jgi:hypothetical protein
MALNKIKVSQLPPVGDIARFIVFGYDAGTGASAKALMEQLRRNVGPAPNIAMSFSPLPYGSAPSVTKTGTTLNPVFSVGFPLAKNGEKPLLRKSEDWIQYKYESDAQWQNLLNLDTLRLHFSDLTPDNIALLQGPASDAADALSSYVAQKEQTLSAIEQQMQAAVSGVQEAIDAANAAAGSANQAAADANTAGEAATAAAENAQTAATEANAAKENANAAAGNAGSAATAATAAKEAAEQATQQTQAAVEQANEANALAQEIAAHPPVIQNGTWWIWNVNTHAYADTGLPARGPQGKGPVVLPSGIYGNWDELTQTYVSSGVPATAAVLLAFQAWATRENVVTGDNVNELAGKIAKWFYSFGPLAWEIPDIDHEPAEDDLSYGRDGVTYPHKIGAEVRYTDGDGNVTFYKLYAITEENRAVWEETGGVSLPGNVYLTGANYYSESVQIINQGILNG